VVHAADDLHLRAELAPPPAPPASAPSPPPHARPASPPCTPSRTPLAQLVGQGKAPRGRLQLLVREPRLPLGHLRVRGAPPGAGEHSQGCARGAGGQGPACREPLRPPRPCPLTRASRCWHTGMACCRLRPSRGCRRRGVGPITMRERSCSCCLQARQHQAHTSKHTAYFMFEPATCLLADRSRGASNCGSAVQASRAPKCHAYSNLWQVYAAQSTLFILQLHTVIHSQYAPWDRMVVPFVPSSTHLPSWSRRPQR